MAPTHHRVQQQANILDLIVTSEDEMIEQLSYGEPIGKSHHTVLDWTLKCYQQHPETRVKKYMYDKGNFEEMRKELRALNWKRDLDEKSVEHIWKFICDTVLTSVDKHVPHHSGIIRRNRRRRPVWMNEKALNRIRKKKAAFTRYKETREGKDYLEYARERNAVKSEVRKAVRDYEKEVAKQSKRNPKAFYRYVNSKLKMRTGIADLQSKDGSKVTSNRDKADVINEFFSSVYTVEDTSNYRPVSLTSVCCKTMEKLIRQAIMTHMIENGYLLDQLHGFVQGKSCTPQLLLVVDKNSEILDDGGSVDMIYVDFAKAFDTVPHQKLLQQLKGYGIGGKVLGFVENFLNARTQQVVGCGWRHGFILG